MSELVDKSNKVINIHIPIELVKNTLDKMIVVRIQSEIGNT